MYGLSDLARSAVRRTLNVIHDFESLSSFHGAIGRHYQIIFGCERMGEGYSDSPPPPSARCCELMVKNYRIINILSTVVFILNIKDFEMV